MEELAFFVVLFQKLFTYMQKHNECLNQAKYCMAFSLDYTHFVERSSKHVPLLF